MINLGLGFLIGLMTGEVLTMLMIMLMQGRDTRDWKGEHNETKEKTDR